MRTKLALSLYNDEKLPFSFALLDVQPVSGTVLPKSTVCIAVSRTCMQERRRRMHRKFMHQEPMATMTAI
jgi:hypothetical protein